MKKQLLKSALIAVAGVGLLSANALAFSFTAYNSYPQWQAMIAPIINITENFEDPTLVPGFSITEVNGAGTIAGGTYTNIVDDFVESDPSDDRYQIFTYSPGMVGFGGFFNLADSYGAGGPGSEIEMWANDNGTWVYIQTIPNTAEGQWYGFTTDTTITEVMFKEGNGNGYQETYFSVDMHIAPSPVPEPATMLLFGTGLIGLTAVARRKKNK